MKELAAAINRLAAVGEMLVEVLTAADEESPTPLQKFASESCPTCGGSGETGEEGTISRVQCRLCLGRGRIRVA